MNTLSDRAKDAIRSALASKGPRKGLLLASAPKMDSDAYAAWSALMLHCNPFKVGIFAQIMMAHDTERAALHKEIDGWFESMPQAMKRVFIIGLDKDRSALERLGAW